MPNVMSTMLIFKYGVAIWQLYLCLPVVRQRWKFRLGETNYPLPCRPNGFIFFSLVIFRNPIFECALQDDLLKMEVWARSFRLEKYLKNISDGPNSVRCNCVRVLRWRNEARPFRLQAKKLPQKDIQSGKFARLPGEKGESSLEIRYLFSFINNPTCIPLTSGSPQQ
jgi:hypothetical protein